VPVKTLRFWSDEGLLPPATRSRNGYRLYGEDATIRVDLVRTLRDAGLGLDAIRKVLRNDLSLADALRLQLAAVEAHASSLQRVAAAIRAALRTNEPNESDIRRLYAVTQLSNEERKRVVERFHERVSEGVPQGDAMRRKLVAASAPALPDNPSPEQLDAWIELSELMNDESFVTTVQKNARELAQHDVDLEKLREANDRTATAAAAARAAGATPESDRGRQIVLGFVQAIADASGKPNDERLERSLYERYLQHDPRLARYQELVAITTGRPLSRGTSEDWAFVTEAVKTHLAPRS
jgi:DNA-binding transcriptional MerR regulator